MLSVQRLDDRGLFAVFPFPLLPLTSGVLLSFELLHASGLAMLLTPTAIWLSGYWEQPLSILIMEWIWAPQLLELLILTVYMLEDTPSAFSWSIVLVNVSLVVITGMSVLAWRSLQALRGVVIHLTLSICTLIGMIWLCMMVAWLLCLLNFWLFLMIFAVIYYWNSGLSLLGRL